MPKGQNHCPVLFLVQKTVALQRIRAWLECAGELLTVEPVVIAASLSTIALHHVEHAESSFEHGYPLLEGYFLGENPLPFPRLDFFTGEEVKHLLDLDPEQQTTL